jgi:hypothetical protein
MHNTVESFHSRNQPLGHDWIWSFISQVSCCTKTNPANDWVAVLAALKAVSRKSFMRNNPTLHAATPRDHRLTVTIEMTTHGPAAGMPW